MKKQNLDEKKIIIRANFILHQFLKIHGYLGAKLLKTIPSKKRTCNNFLTSISIDLSIVEKMSSNPHSKQPCSSCIFEKTSVLQLHRSVAPIPTPPIPVHPYAGSPKK